MTIIRHAPGISGVKRLGDAAATPGTAGSAPASAVVAPGPTPEQVRATLRTQFGAELELLREEARREGRLAADAEAKAALQAAEAGLDRQLAAVQAQRDADLAAHQQALAALMEKLAGEVESLRREAETAALTIAYQAVLRLLGQQVADGGLLPALVAQCLREHCLEGPVTVRVAPSVAAGLKDFDDRVVVIADANLAPGDCRLEAGETRIDAGIAEQLARLRDLFLDGLESAREEA